MLMKFEWLKELLSEIEDNQCQCHEGFTSRSMTDPACQVHDICDEIIERVSDRLAYAVRGGKRIMPYLDDAIGDIQADEDFEKYL